MEQVQDTLKQDRLENWAQQHGVVYNEISGKIVFEYGITWLFVKIDTWERRVPFEIGQHSIPDLLVDIFKEHALVREALAWYQ